MRRHSRGSNIRTTCGCQLRTTKLPPRYRGKEQTWLVPCADNFTSSVVRMLAEKMHAGVPHIYINVHTYVHMPHIYHLLLRKRKCIYIYTSCIYADMFTSKICPRNSRNHMHSTDSIVVCVYVAEQCKHADQEQTPNNITYVLRIHRKDMCRWIFKCALLYKYIRWLADIMCTRACKHDIKKKNAASVLTLV